VEWGIYLVLRGLKSLSPLTGEGEDVRRKEGSKQGVSDESLGRRRVAAEVEGGELARNPQDF